jgi:hypothetical protein
MTDGMTTDATTVSDFEDDDGDDNDDNNDNDDNDINEDDEDDIPGHVESESKGRRKLNVRNGQTLQELPGIE